MHFTQGLRTVPHWPVLAKSLSRSCGRSHKRESSKRTSATNRQSQPHRIMGLQDIGFASAAAWTDSSGDALDDIDIEFGDVRCCYLLIDEVRQKLMDDICKVKRRKPEALNYVGRSTLCSVSVSFKSIHFT